MSEKVKVEIDKETYDKIKARAEWEGLTISQYIKILAEKTPFIFSH